jgi:signal transduction histidine kinase
MQSSTASVVKEASGQFAALRFVSRRLDLGIVDEPAGMVASTTAQDRARDDHREARLEPGALRVAEGAGLAHDAGNLLGALSLYSELLSAPGVLNEEYREYAAELRMLSERSHAMISRLVEHARGGNQNAEEAMTVLPEVVTRCRGLLSRVAGRRVDVAFGARADMPVKVAAEAIERILTNLVKNASESMTDDGGSIIVSVAGVADGGEGREPRVMMTVSDTGRGMTAEARSALGEATATNSCGRGLGFRVVRELAAMSDGCLTVASRPGEGTSVAVEWRAVELLAMEGRDGTRKVMRGAAGWIAC